jgi:hypothetical protein
MAEGGSFTIRDDDPRSEGAGPPGDADQVASDPTKSLYLVYSIEADNQPAGEWRGEKKTDVAFIPSPKGAYFADSKKQACGLAALRFGRAGTYVAVKTKAQRITFSSSKMPEEEIAHLEKRARKELKRRRKAGH